MKFFSIGMQFNDHHKLNCWKFNTPYFLQESQNILAELLLLFHFEDEYSLKVLSDCDCIFCQLQDLQLIDY